MQRIVEPELMDDKVQAEAYANADFEQAEKLFLDTYQHYFPCSMIRGNILDLGCGPGNISFKLASHFPNSKITGIDGSAEMIKLANKRKKANSNFSGRVNFITGIILGDVIPQAHYYSIVSNSLLHHLHHPQVLWETIKQYSSPNTNILIIDLFRPPSTEDALATVNKYACDEPEVLQRDFYNSLLAAFTVTEIEQQLFDAGLTELKLRSVSDRHLAIVGTKTGEI